MTEPFKGVVLKTSQALGLDSVSFSDLTDTLANAFAERVKRVNEQRLPIVIVDVPNLYSVFVDALEAKTRQHYDCIACRRFTSYLGKLAYINPQNEFVPLYWNADAVPDAAKPAIQALHDAVAGAESFDYPAANRMDYLGTAANFSTSGTLWHHFHLHDLPYTEALLHDVRVKRELLTHHIHRFHGTKLQTLDRAIECVTSLEFLRKDQLLHALNWLRDAYREISATSDGRIRRRVLARLAWQAPAGTLNLGATALGTLITGIELGYDPKTVCDDYNRITDPEVYMRMQREASDAELQKAIDTIDRLGYGKSLLLRHARMEDVPDSYWVWRPTAPRADDTSDNPMRKLLDKPIEPVVYGTHQDAMRISVQKFLSILTSESVSKVSVLRHVAPRSYVNYTGLVTYQHADAKPIFWQAPGEPQTVLSTWSMAKPLAAMYWFEETQTELVLSGILRKPKNSPGESDSVFLVLRDAHIKGSIANPLFPETLNRELRECNRAIETFNAKTHVEPDPESLSCIRLDETSEEITVAVTAANRVRYYRLVIWA